MNKIQTDPNRCYTREGVQMANRYIKFWATSLLIREMQINPTSTPHNEISSHTWCLLPKDEREQWMLARMRREEKPCALLIGMQIGIVTTEDTMEAPQKIKNRMVQQSHFWTNLDSILKSRDITLPIKVRLVKAMVFPVVIYGCESWTIKNPE